MRIKTFRKYRKRGRGDILAPGMVYFPNIESRCHPAWRADPWWDG